MNPVAWGQGTFHLCSWGMLVEIERKGYPGVLILIYLGPKTPSRRILVFQGVSPLPVSFIMEGLDRDRVYSNECLCRGVNPVVWGQGTFHLCSSGYVGSGIDTEG